MNIQSQISEELWNSISVSYNSENYSNAIKDAFLFLTDLIRIKSGIESGDGEALIGEAFRKKDPLIKINKYETDTEKSEQDGFQFLLRGLYKAIRNPRNHETIFDTEDYANKIILFLDLICQRITESKDAFDLGEFINLIFDSDFEFDEKYMELLLQEIPEKYKSDAVIEIYRKAKQISSKNSSAFLKYLIKDFNEYQKDQFIKICSSDLLRTKDSSIMRLIISIIEPRMWTGIEKKAKFRIENILIDCIDVGSYDIEGELPYGTTKSGYSSSLGTWAMNLCTYFDETSKLNGIIHRKCARIDENIDEVYYVLKWFSKYIFKNIKSNYIIHKLITKISEGDQFIEKCVSEYRDDLSDEQQKEYYDAILKFNEIHEINLLSDDEIPF